MDDSNSLLKKIGKYFIRFGGSARRIEARCALNVMLKAHIFF